jgi:hypothetical protein
MWLSKVIIQVRPSGGALAAIAAPIAPAAPGLLSITVCQPVLSLTLAASRRTTGSVVPPGGKGTTTRIGPFGQSAWALAADDAVRAATALPSRARRSKSWVRDRGSDPLPSMERFLVCSPALFEVRAAVELNGGICAARLQVSVQ